MKFAVIAAVVLWVVAFAIYRATAHTDNFGAGVFGLLVVALAAMFTVISMIFGLIHLFS